MINYEKLILLKLNLNYSRKRNACRCDVIAKENNPNADASVNTSTAQLIADFNRLDDISVTILILATYDIAQINKQVVCIMVGWYLIIIFIISK